MFSTNPRNLASERYFYEFKELGEDELLFVNDFIGRAREAELQAFNKDWLNLFQMPFQVRSFLSSKPPEDPRRVEVEDKLLVIQKTLAEDLHAAYENGAVEMLRNLKEQVDTDWRDPERRGEFLFFLALQYVRTLKHKNAIGGLEVPAHFDLKSLWSVMQFIFASNIAYGLFSKHEKYNLTFLRNQTEIRFIAGDQPIVNLNVSDDPDLKLFYPLSPSLALLLSPSDEIESKYVDVSEIVAEGYNYLMFCKSEAQVFGADNVYLEGLIKLPKM